MAACKSKECGNYKKKAKKFCSAICKPSKNGLIKNTVIEVAELIGKLFIKLGGNREGSPGIIKIQKADMAYLFGKKKKVGKSKLQKLDVTLLNSDYILIPVIDWFYITRTRLLDTGTLASLDTVHDVVMENGRPCVTG